MDKEIDIKRIKRSRIIGLVLLIMGAISFIFGLWYTIFFPYNYSFGRILSVLPIGLGIILLVIGFIMIIYNSIKLSK